MIQLLPKCPSTSIWGFGGDIEIQAITSVHKSKDGHNMRYPFHGLSCCNGEEIIAVCNSMNEFQKQVWAKIDILEAFWFNFDYSFKDAKPIHGVKNPDSSYPWKSQQGGSPQLLGCRKNFISWQQQSCQCAVCEGLPSSTYIMCVLCVCAPCRANLTQRDGKRWLPEDYSGQEGQAGMESTRRDSPPKLDFKFPVS